MAEMNKGSADRDSTAGGPAISAAHTPIYVTRTFLPPRHEYDHWLDKVYASHVLTNNGPIHRELEETLRARFEVPHLRLMSNGTLALQLAIRTLGITGKVITTPYSYVATTSAILWEGCTPVFADINPDTLCIDPARIEELIDADTTAILATHVYGIPCDVEAIDSIARKHGLKVIYDAAHAFDVQYKGKSILAYGDASTLSFHATKLFHTVEGGAIVLHDDKTDHRLKLLRSFGHIGDEHFSLGINAKMSELHAAMGMAVLPHLSRCIQDREHLAGRYRALLAGPPLRYPTLPDGTGYNFAYFPILFASAEVRGQVQRTLASAGIHARRYFFPSLNKLPYVPHASMPISEHAADTVLSLPFYPELSEADQLRITQVIKNIIG